jgi:hypothetical protein
VLYTNNAYGQGLAQEFKKAFEANGGKVLTMVPHEQGAPSYSAELKKVMAGKPQAVAAFGYPISASVYMKEAIELYNFNNFFFCDGTKSVDLLPPSVQIRLRVKWVQPQAQEAAEPRISLSRHLKRNMAPCHRCRLLITATTPWP